MQKKAEKIVGIFQCSNCGYIVKKNINDEYIVEQNLTQDIDVTTNKDKDDKDKDDKDNKDEDLKSGPLVYIINESYDNDECLQKDFFNDKITANVYVYRQGHIVSSFENIDSKKQLCKYIEEMYKNTNINVKRQEYKDEVFLPTQQDRHFLYKNSDNKWVVAQGSIILSPFKHDFETKNFQNCAELLNESDCKLLKDIIRYLDNYYANTFHSLIKQEIELAISKSTTAEYAINAIDGWIKYKMFKLDTNRGINNSKSNDLLSLMNKIQKIKETKQKIDKIILPKGKIYNNTNYDYFKTLFKTIKENKNELQQYMEQFCSTKGNNSIELSIGPFHKLLYNHDNKKLIVQNKFEHACINAEIDLNKDINKCNNYDKFTINIDKGEEVQINNLPKNIHILLDHASINVYDDRYGSLLKLPSNAINSTSNKKNKTSRFITALQDKISQMTMGVNQKDFNLLLKKCLEAIVATTSNHSVSITKYSNKDKTAIKECYYLNGTGPIKIRNSNVISKNNIVSEMKKE